MEQLLEIAKQIEEEIETKKKNLMVEEAKMWKQWEIVAEKIKQGKNFKRKIKPFKCCTEEYGDGDTVTTCTYTDGKIYKGEIKYDNRHGLGQIICPDGDIYTRYNHYNVPSKFGVYEFSDGSSYRGSISTKRHGFGIYNSSLGYYVGVFSKDKRTGNGILYDQEVKIVGDRENGKLNGFCMETRGSQLIYLGYIENGKRYGVGYREFNNDIVGEEYEEGMVKKVVEIIHNPFKKAIYSIKAFTDILITLSQ